jgi:uncharacterized protein YbaR (Trm112 family)
MTDELAASLVCPLTRTPLRWDREAGLLVSEEAGLAYRMREGIPILPAEAATRLRVTGAS